MTISLLQWKQFTGVVVYADGRIQLQNHGGGLWPGGQWLDPKQIYRGDLLVRAYKASGLQPPEVLDTTKPFFVPD